MVELIERSAHCADVATAKFSQRSLEIQTAMDVLSDASSKYRPLRKFHALQTTTSFTSKQLRSRYTKQLTTVFIIPTTLLWKVQMTMRKKFALRGIFSLTIFIMAASITRVLVVTQKNSSIDQPWMYSWSAIEMSIGTPTPIPTSSNPPHTSSVTEPKQPS